MADLPTNPSQKKARQEIIAPGGHVDREQLLQLWEDSTGDEDQPPVVTFVLQRDLAKRLDRYLVDRIPFLSRTSLQRLITEQAVTVNGRAPKASTRLRRGDIVQATLPPPPSREIPAEQMDLAVLFEDEDLIVLNKQDDIIVHPARGNRSGTMINGLAWHFNARGGQLSPVGESLARPGVVHRLDRHTTGAIVFAKSEEAHWQLGKQFEHRKTDKRYLAVVHGRMEPHADVIDLPLGRHPTVRERYAVRWDQTGKASVTIYRVREIYEEFSLVELELKTGRTHQIRVHLSHLGHPIVGDDVYGGRHLTVADVAHEVATTQEAATPLICRQALHAASLGFTHPISRKTVEYQAPLPEDMAKLIHMLRKHRYESAPKVAGATLDLDPFLAMP